MNATKKARVSTKQRIIEEIAKCHGAASVGLLAQDLSLAVATIKRHVATLITEKRIALGYDGHCLLLTETELQERAIDARVRSHR